MIFIQADFKYDGIVEVVVRRKISLGKLCGISDFVVGIAFT